jgi:hypothetical protein
MKTAPVATLHHARSESAPLIRAMRREANTQTGVSELMR